MPQHIGIVACSAGGAALCYRTISWKAPICWGNHPEISMHSRLCAQYVNCICANNWAGVAELMLSSTPKRWKT
jgi:aspartate racemase